MGGTYLWITPVQSTFFDIGEDEDGTPLLSCNFEGRAINIVNLADEIIGILTGLCTLGVDTFIGPVAQLPTDSDGPLIQFITTGGAHPSKTHNGQTYRNFSFQIVVRARTYAAAEARASAIHAVLNDVLNVTT